MPKDSEYRKHQRKAARARWAGLSDEERSEIGRAAAKARWDKVREAKRLADRKSAS